MADTNTGYRAGLLGAAIGLTISGLGMFVVRVLIGGEAVSSRPQILFLVEGAVGLSALVILSLWPKPDSRA